MTKCQKRQKDKKIKRQKGEQTKDKKTKDKDQKESSILRRQGRFALLRCFIYDLKTVMISGMVFS